MAHFWIKGRVFFQPPEGEAIPVRKAKLEVWITTHNFIQRGTEPPYPFQNDFLGWSMYHTKMIWRGTTDLKGQFSMHSNLQDVHPDLRNYYFAWLLVKQGSNHAWCYAGDRGPGGDLHPAGPKPGYFTVPWEPEIYTMPPKQKIERPGPKPKVDQPVVTLKPKKRGGG